MTAAPPELQVPGSRVLRWRGVDGLSAEVLRFTATADGFEAHSDLVDLDSPGFSVTYDWSLDSGWRTRRLSLRLRAEAERRLVIERAGDGAWIVDGAPRPDLDGCAEVDLQVTPFCNSLAIRQLGEGELTALYVPFPALEPVASRQRYDRLGRGEYRYVDLGAHAGFQARLSLDADGFVRRYEGVFEMIQNGDEP